VEDRAGVRLGPLVVNGCDLVHPALGRPSREAADAVGISLSDAEAAALDAARQFRIRRQALQAEQIDRLGRELPLPQLRTPVLSSPSIGPEELELLAGALAEGVQRLAPA
jgi:hypothetical protein